MILEILEKQGPSSQSGAVQRFRERNYGAIRQNVQSCAITGSQPTWEKFMPSRFPSEHPSTNLSLCSMAIVTVLICLLSGCEKASPPLTLESSATGNAANHSDSNPDFNPQVVIPRAFPAIVKPKSVSTEEGDKELHDQELVLGVEVNGEARAYPINMLTGPEREIVNDQLGGESIAATW